jgi:hypothetical protein
METLRAEGAAVLSFLRARIRDLTAPQKQAALEHPQARKAPRPLENDRIRPEQVAAA